MKFRPILLSLTLISISPTMGNWIPGYSEAIADAELAFPVPGILDKWFFEEGDVVPEGAVVAELDSGLEGLEIERRRLLMESARKEYERVKTVYERGSVVSEGEVDAAKSAFDVAEMEHRLAQEQFERRRMRAPFEGVLVTTFGLETGEAIERNQPVARISDPASCRLVCYVDADLAFDLKPGDNGVLRFRIRGESVEVNGAVGYVSPVVDPASGLVEVRVVFSNASGEIRPGIAGEVRFPDAGGDAEGRES